eukprot:gene26564-32612_t
MQQESSSVGPASEAKASAQPEGAEDALAGNGAETAEEGPAAFPESELLVGEPQAGREDDGVEVDAVVDALLYDLEERERLGWSQGVDPASLMAAEERDVEDVLIFLVEDVAMSFVTEKCRAVSEDLTSCAAQMAPARPVTAAQLNTISLFVQLMVSGTSEGKVNAAGMLSRMAEDARLCAPLVEQGALPPLVALLGGREGGGSDAAKALRHLAEGGASLREALAKAEAIPALVRALAGAGDDTGRKRAHAAGALMVLAEDGSLRNRIAEAGGVTALVRLLASEPAGRADAAHALMWLGSDNHILRHEMVQAGSAAALARLLQEGSPEEQACAAGALRSLTRNKEGCDAVVQAGAICWLIVLLEVGTDCGKLNAAQALLGLASVHGFEQRLAEAGIIYPM